MIFNTNLHIVFFLQKSLEHALDRYTLKQRPQEKNNILFWNKRFWFQLFKLTMFVCLFVYYLTSQQHASVFQGWICLDKSTCCQTEMEVADQTFQLTQSQYTDTRPTSPSTDAIMPDAWQGSHWSANFSMSLVRLDPENILAQEGIEPWIFRSWGGLDALTTTPRRWSSNWQGVQGRVWSEADPYLSAGTPGSGRWCAGQTCAPWWWAGGQGGWTAGCDPHWSPRTPSPPCPPSAHSAL